VSEGNQSMGLLSAPKINRAFIPDVSKLLLVSVFTYIPTSLLAFIKFFLFSFIFEPKKPENR
jgi:hypothetical protein